MSVRSGRLEPLKLYKIFRSLLGGKSSGVLTLSRGPAIKRSRLLEGRLLRTASNLKRESMLFGLREQGFVTAAEAEEIERFREAQNLTIEAALLRMGLVDRARILQLELRLSQQRLLDAFTWRDGEFTFLESPIKPDSGETPADPVELLLEAAAKVSPAEDCDAFVAGYPGQLVAATPWNDTYGARFDELFGVPNIRNLLHGPQPFVALSQRIGDESATSRQICGLVLAGLGRFTAPTGEAAARVPSRRPSAPPPAVVTVRRTAPPAETAPSGPPSARPAPPSGRSPTRAPNSTASRPSSRPPAPASAEKPAATAQAARPGGTARPSRAPQQVPDKDRKVIQEAERIHGKLKMSSHYDLLRLERDAAADAVRARFRALARDYHADRFARYGLSDDVMRRIQQVFMAINRAHELLSDVEARREYDLALEMAAKGQRVQAQEGTDVGQLFQAEHLVKDGVLALRNGNARVAHNKFQQALDINALDIVAQAGSAYAEYLLAKAGERPASDADAARRVLERVVEENENREEPFLYLGRVYRAEADTDRAAQCFKRALEINERCAEAASELRHLQRRADDSKRGIFGRKKT